jgi:predicted secreted Zn-dependent protease
MPLYRHRSVPDVRLTVEVLLRLLKKVEEEHPEIVTVEGLQALSQGGKKRIEVPEDQLTLF